MDRMIENTSASNIINISERKGIVITGVKKIESFDSEEFLLNTNLGIILLKGENLEMIKLDTLEANVTIKGKINSLQYVDSKNEAKEESFLGKLFK